VPRARHARAPSGRCARGGCPPPSLPAPSAFTRKASSSSFPPSLPSSPSSPSEYSSSDHSSSLPIPLPLSLLSLSLSRLLALERWRLPPARAKAAHGECGGCTGRLLCQPAPPVQARAPAWHWRPLAPSKLRAPAAAAPPCVSRPGRPLLAQLLVEIGAFPTECYGIESSACLSRRRREDEGLAVW
jgi:hypothetical protein